MDFLPVPRAPRLWKNKAEFFSFRTAAVKAGENIIPLYDPTLHRTEPEEPDLSELNTALSALVDIFPDVHPEVFREMLSSISRESRLQLVTENLLTKKAKWVRGRYRTPQAASTGKVKKQTATRQTADLEPVIPEEETFRSDSYKKAVKQVFYQEFKSLSHSSIKAVLAEQNFSYTLARPSLQQLAARSWRFSISSFWSRRSPSSAAGEHPYIIWQPSFSGTEQPSPAVKRTGSSKLDHELYDLFVAPVLENQRQTLLSGDYAFAARLNEAEAAESEALFDCECCYSSVTFECVSTCDDGCHQLCFDCVRRTVSEALFGQGWARTVDLERSTVRCFAPTTLDCKGIIPSSLLRRALASRIDKDDIWNEFQERAASENLAKSQIHLQRCPYCNYVEVDETPAPKRREMAAIWKHVTTQSSAAFQLTFLCIIGLLLVFTIPLLLVVGLGWLSVYLIPSLSTIFAESWSRVHTKRRCLKFRCRKPNCSKTTCIRCLAIWKDLHTCFENEKTSLRTAIEASATAAIKRTCPKCLLSFVKSSGCNKLVCNCGYTMCYICRQEITSKEGYSHFCQHFRPSGGRCTECERCDLYGDEDEEMAIRNAAEAAEKAWKDKENGREGNELATKAMVDALVGQARAVKTWQVWLDAVVDAVIAGSESNS